MFHLVSFAPSRARRICLTALAAVALALFGASAARALDIEFGGRVVKREILALFDGRHERKPHLTRLHKLAEMPLNHLGYTLAFHDIQDGLPPSTELSRYRGILTWFLEPMRQPDRYLNWLEQALQSDLSYVVIGEIAPPEPEFMQPAINRILARLGLATAGEYVELTFKSRVTSVNPSVIGFERPLDKVLPGYPIRTVRGGEASVHLSITSKGPKGDLVAAIVATSQRGGIVPHDYAVFYDPNTERVRWIVNPFAFFKLALGSERFPAPDVTTVSGRRIYFSHIDGDGWNNMSEIEHYRALQIGSAEVVAREAIVPYPDLPVTVGLIAGDIEPALGGQVDGGRIARMLYALPQVEVASHTYTHPYHWHFFERYSRAAEEKLISAHPRAEEPIRQKLANKMLKLAGKPIPPSQFDPYIAGSDELPRTYMREPFDLEREIGGALAYAERFAPAGRKARIYLWSGDTTPFEGAIKATRKAGVRNINGGDSRLDADYPSVAYVPPISRPMGSERQIFAVNSNENTYTNDWAGPYYGFFMLEHTLRNTERPRRLKAFNLYYHMYSGEKAGALAAIKHFLERARREAVAPIAASDYAAIADDYFSVEIEQVSLSSWAIQRRGAVHTVRLDDADQIAINLAQSPGVIGATRHAGSLYVTLDPSIERAILAIKPRIGEEIAELSATRPLFLIDARWRLSRVSSLGCGLSAVAQGYGPGEMRWQSAPKRAFAVTAYREGAELYHQMAVADAAGVLDVTVPAVGLEPLTVRFECHD